MERKTEGKRVGAMYTSFARVLINGKCDQLSLRMPVFVLATKE